MISPSTFQFNTKIPLATLQQLANKQLAGIPLPVEQFELIPNDIRVNGEGKQLVIRAVMSGSFRGNATIKATPIYNKSDRNIDFNEVDLDLEGTDFKSKGIAMLASKIIEEQIDKHVKIPIKTMVEDLNLQIRKNEIQPGVFLEASIIDYNVNELKVNEQVLDIQLEAEGIFSFKVSDSLEEQIA